MTDRELVIARLRELLSEAWPVEGTEAAQVARTPAATCAGADVVTIERVGRDWQFVLPGCERWRRSA